MNPLPPREQCCHGALWRFLGVDDFLDGSDGWFGCSHAGRPIKYRSHIDGAEISGECSCIIWYLPSRGSEEPSKRTGSHP
jgi:hypothetical protein